MKENLIEGVPIKTKEGVKIYRRTIKEKLYLVICNDHRYIQ